MPIVQFLHTIRHLTLRQIVGQVRNRIRPGFENRERFWHQIGPAFERVGWDARAKFIVPGAQLNSVGNLQMGRFQFLNREKEIGWPPDWEVPGGKKLWQYNLHYFEWLWALEFDDAREAALDWILNHELGKGAVGWEPYPISLRLMNWCGVFYGKFREETAACNEAAPIRRSIFLQTEWLLKHIETHLLGNHLLENAVALAFVGECFSGAFSPWAATKDPSKRWMEKGLKILNREIPEQILSDGMHFERSPMYHVRMCFLLRLLADTGSDILKSLVGEPLERMEQALANLCHPDGEIPLFNDSAFSIYNRPSDLTELSAHSTPGPWALQEAGYFGFRGANGSYIICDAGPVGPDYIPGHAHGDMFSFELSLSGHRVIVDGGVYDYIPGEMRRYCRSTRAHNTVEINGEDQCEFWGAFRVARRGHPHDILWEPASRGFRLSGWHDGYRRLPGAPVHHRTIEWNDDDGQLTIEDRITARKAVRAVSRLHLHPTCQIVKMTPGEAVIEYPAGRFRVSLSGPGELVREESFYCPEFGRKEKNDVLAVALEGTQMQTSFSVSSE